MVIFKRCTACNLPIVMHVDDGFVVSEACVGGCPARSDNIGKHLEDILYPKIKWEKEPGDDYVSILQVWEEAQMARLLRRERYDPTVHLAEDFDSPPQEWTERYKKAALSILNVELGATGEY